MQKVASREDVREPEHRALSPRTKDNYEYHLERQILPVLGDLALAENSPADVRVWFAGLGTAHRTRNAGSVGRALVDLLRRAVRQRNFEGLDVVRSLDHRAVL